MQFFCIFTKLDSAASFERAPPHQSALHYHHKIKEASFCLTGASLVRCSAHRRKLSWFAVHRPLPKAWVLSKWPEPQN